MLAVFLFQLCYFYYYQYYDNSWLSPYGQLAISARDADKSQSPCKTHKEMA